MADTSLEAVERLALEMDERVRYVNALTAATLRALSARVAELEAGQWQPIETAPKDESRVDLSTAGGIRITGGVWGVVEYSEEMDGRDVMGWTSAYSHGPVEEAGTFTHWMTPPPAPKVEP